MATTNFEQWNPSSLNQETDAEYLADTQRLGGVTTGSLAPSATMNKFYYQVSTFIAAFGQMLATKGYTNSDSSVALLASVLANVVTESDFATNIISVAYSPTPAFNATNNNGFQMTLSGNITASSIIGITPGQLLAFYFVQDSVGSRTVSWPSSFVGALQPDTAAASVSVMLFRADLSGTVRAVSPMISNNGIFAPNPPSSSDSTQRIATTSWVKGLISALTGGFSYSATTNGYVKFPSWVGSFMIQWGTVSSSNAFVNFSPYFSSFAVVVPGSNNSGGESPITASSTSVSGFYIGCSGGNDAASWIAVGF
jgi:hypothetical protein